MTSPKLTHVAVAGLAAGAVMNLTATAFRSLVLPTADSYLWNFVFGMIGVSLYAVMSAGSGPSPARAVVTGTTFWVIASALPDYVMFSAGVLPQPNVTFSAVLGLVEIVPAIVAGAWGYDWAVTTQQARVQKQESRNTSTMRVTPHTPLTVEAI